MMPAVRIKIPCAAFICVLVYWPERGPANFLWLANVAIPVIVAALWMESRFLTSMLAAGVLSPEFDRFPE